MARTITVTELRTRYSWVLDEVDRGESFVVTRFGKPIATLVSHEAERKARIRQAIEDLREFAKGRNVDQEEIAEMIREGRK